MSTRVVNFADLYCEKAFKVIHDDIWRSGNPHSEYWLAGGRGSTKSCFISMEIILGMLHDTSASAIVFRRVGNTLKDSVYEQMIWAIDMLGLGSMFIFRRSPLEIIRPKTGQRILFRGADDPMKSKSIRLKVGQEFRFLWFEELAEFRGMDDVRVIKQSIFRSVERGITFYSYNPPKSAQSWVNVERFADRQDRMVNVSDYTMVNPDWLKAQFIAEAEALRDTNEAAYRNEYLGEITGTGGQVFDNLDIRTITDEEIDTLDRFYNGQDFGFAVDPDAFVRCAYDARSRKLYIIDEFYAAHTPTDQLCEAVKRIAGREIVRCDSADPRMINELRQRGINAVGVRKGSGSREHSYRWLQELGAIVVDPKRTPNAARELRAYEYERDRNGNFYVNYPDGNDHSLDALRYAVMELAANRVAKAGV